MKRGVLPLALIGFVAAAVTAAALVGATGPSIYGDDAPVWALARGGRCAEAVPLARRAHRLGTEDGLLLFHLGCAHGCGGDRARMLAEYRRALAVSPSFSVRWAPVALAVLRNG